VKVTVAAAVLDATAVVMLSAAAAALTQPTHGVETKVGMVSTDVSILIPIVVNGVAMIALLAIKLRPVQVIDTLDFAAIAKFTVNATDVDEGNDKFEFPAGKPHKALDKLFTKAAGNDNVTTPPLAKSDDTLNKKDAVPPAPTAVDMTEPVRVALRQPTHGIESRLTNNAVSLSNLLTSA
jgi:hypothetical protein